ncbi:MAG: response regulator [Anaerolineales bacterium]|nr:response regulator [Anaerolineales bacterium]
MTDLNTILLIDDNKADNFFHKVVLKKAGFSGDVLEMTYAEQALSLLETQTTAVELIFLDINMPRMNGFEFLEAYDKLADEKRAKAIVIMLTTSLNPADRTRATTFMDVKGFCSKPLTVENVKILLEDYPNIPFELL